ncbi:MAG: methylated-DNA--[protein]-cysteine S-methyltransferase [Gemmatimonadota bacterium]
MPPALGFSQQVYRLVRRIPRGKVATYGQLARLAGGPTRAREVGYAMAALPTGTGLPWHRVINARGEVSRRKRPGAELTQRMLLVGEGLRFNARGRVSLEEYQWAPRRAARK